MPPSGDGGGGGVGLIERGLRVVSRGRDSRKARDVFVIEMKDSRLYRNPRLFAALPRAGPPPTRDPPTTTP